MQNIVRDRLSFYQPNRNFPGRSSPRWWVLLLTELFCLPFLGRLIDVWMELSTHSSSPSSSSQVGTGTPLGLDVVTSPSSADSSNRQLQKMGFIPLEWGLPYVDGNSLPLPYCL